MCYYIGIEDLAASALIELLGTDKNRRSVSFETLTQYGIAVVRLLEQHGKEAVLLLSQNYTLAFVQECTDLFEFDNLDGDRASITLRAGKTREDLIKRFCGSIPLPILSALGDESSVDVLLEAAA